MKYLAAVFLSTASLAANAAAIRSFEVQLDVDGTFESFFLDPQSVTCDDCSGSLDASGLGTLSVEFDGAGAHSVGMLLDYEIDQDDNTFFNEFGTTANVANLPAGLSWEIDEPGTFFGDIFDNFSVGALDGTNPFSPGFVDDVAMALWWDFDLLAGETAVVDFVISTVMPASGFHLAHIDPDSDARFYFSSSLTVTPAPVTSAPAPMTLALLLLGLLSLRASRHIA